MKNFFSVISVIFVLSIVVVAFTLGLAGLHLTSTGIGEHTGYVTAVDQSGYIWRNYVVYFKTDNSSSQEDDYCINRANTDLIAKIKEVNQTRKLVTLYYHGVRAWGLGICNGSEIDRLEIK